MGPSYVPQTHMAIWVNLMCVRSIWLYGSILCTSDPYGYMGPSYVPQTLASRPGRREGKAAWGILFLVAESAFPQNMSIWILSVYYQIFCWHTFEKLHYTCTLTRQNS